MTTLQRTTIVGAVIGALLIIGYQARQISGLRRQVRSLEQVDQQHAALTEQVHQLQRERDRATNALAALADENATLKKHPTEVLKLRGEVGQLRRENTEAGSRSPLSKITASPEARKMLRDQQQLGMSMIYKSLAKQLNLTPEQTAKLNDLLADHIMENVDHVTTVLRDQLSPEQMDALFASQETALKDQLKTVLGDDGVSRYQDYTQHLLSRLTTDQFDGKLTGTPEEKAAKAKQFRQALDDETQAALTRAGLAADYQVVPILNFRNIASEQAGEKGVKLLEEIYNGAAGRGAAFLNPEELASFKEFTATAVKTSRGALALNRTLMAPLGSK